MEQVTQSEPYTLLKAMLDQSKINKSRLGEQMVVNLKDIEFVERNKSCIKGEENNVVWRVLVG